MNLLFILDILALLYAAYMLILPFWWLGIHLKVAFVRKLKWIYYITPVILFVLIMIIIFNNYSLITKVKVNTYYTFYIGVLLAILVGVIDFYRSRNFSFFTLIGLPEFFPRKYNRKIINSGIFSYIRHPRYLEYILFALAMAFITGLVISYLFFVFTLIAFNILARYEEKELVERFGKKYIDYMKKVPRFIPKIKV